MAKPLPRRIPSDRCPVTNRATGEIYYPHEGEWVDMYAGLTVGEIQAIQHLRRLGTEMAAIEGEPDQFLKTLELLDPHYEELTTLLAGRLAAWNWTDDAGRPLLEPDGTPLPLKRLRSDELYWLMNAAEEAPDDRKNVLAPSPTTSLASATSTPPAPSSTGGRSRTRAS